MGAAPDIAVLRRSVLAVAVLDDVDLEPGPDGVRPADATGPVVVGWDRVRRALGSDAPESPAARLRIATLLRVSALLAAGPPSPDWVGHHVRALALPPGHALHPGRAWVRERVLGGVLDVGLGLVELPWPAAGGPVVGDGPVPLPPGAVLDGWSPRLWWPQAREHAGRMGSLAGGRIEHAAPGTVRPVGGCDVLTLLATRSMRTALAADGSGMRAVAVPTRQRGWYDLRRVDTAYVAAVWTATEEVCRGVPRPLLVTRDEVAPPRPGGNPVGQSLDRAPQTGPRPADAPPATPPTRPTG
jgi:hypothetical protein